MSRIIFDEAILHDKSGLKRCNDLGTCIYIYSRDALDNKVYSRIPNLANFEDIRRSLREILSIAPCYITPANCMKSRVHSQPFKERIKVGLNLQPDYSSS